MGPKECNRAKGGQKTEGEPLVGQQIAKQSQAVGRPNLQSQCGFHGNGLVTFVTVLPLATKYSRGRLVQKIHKCPVKLGKFELKVVALGAPGQHLLTVDK